MMTLLFLTWKNISLFQGGVCIHQQTSAASFLPWDSHELQLVPVCVFSSTTLHYFLGIQVPSPCRSPVCGRGSAVGSAYVEKVCACCRSEPEQVMITAVIWEHFTLSKSWWSSMSALRGKNYILRICIFLLMCYFYIWLSSDSAQLEKQGRKSGWRNKVIDRTKSKKQQKSLSANLSVRVLKVSCKHFIDPGTASSFSLRGMQHYLAYLVFGLTHLSYELHSALLFFLIIGPVLFPSGLRIV